MAKKKDDAEIPAAPSGARFKGELGAFRIGDRPVKPGETLTVAEHGRSVVDEALKRSDFEPAEVG